MKTIGLIGGTGPESTIEYYKRIIAAYKQRVPDAFPSILINSIDAAPLISFITNHQFDRVAALLTREVSRLADGGADFAAISANTPHVVFDEVNASSRIPMISIIEATADAARTAKLRKLALLGTHVTMETGFYEAVFTKHEMSLVIPSNEERDYVHNKYMGELFNGLVLDETRVGLTNVVSAMRERDQIEGVILGGTELSLIITERVFAGIPVLDTTQIHVEAIVREALA